MYVLSDITVHRNKEAPEATHLRYMFLSFLHIYYFQALQDAASVIKSKYNKTLVEASGGITEDTLVDYLLPEIDVVSLSRLTQGYDTVDFSLKIRKDGVDPTNQPVEELFIKI